MSVVFCFVFLMSETMVFLERPWVILFSTEMERGMGGGFERDFARKEMGMSRSFGEPLGRGMGKKAPRAPRWWGPPPGVQAHSDVRRFFLRLSQLFFLKLLKTCVFLDLDKNLWSLIFFY